jgi:cytochrome P450
MWGVYVPAFAVVGSAADVADRDFPHASIVEGLRFTAQVAVPNVIQGLFRRRRTATQVAAKTGADGLAVGFMAGLKRSYGDGPLWIRVGGNEAVLALGEDAIRHALEQAPDPFAADPEPKKSAMARFQPDALTISRGEDWKDRRAFTEAVLDGGKTFTERFAAISREEASKLSHELDWEAWNEAVRRVARRVILGDGAADDAELSQMLGELMDKANPPGKGDDQLLERFQARLEPYVDAGEAESLVSMFASAPKTDRTKPAHQVTHWLFALGDTLAINAARCLALLAIFDAERERALSDSDFMDACLNEAMRLWPTTPMLSRATVRDAEWDGVPIKQGTQVMIVNTFNHRDRDALGDRADRFVPEAWLSDADDWTFNHFSHGPQGCPGASLSLLVGRELLSALLRDHDVQLLSPRIDPAKPLPHSLDYFSLRFGLTDPASR